MTDFILLKVHVFSYTGKYLFIIVANFPSPLTISFPYTSKMLFEFKPLFEKNGLTDFQEVLLSDTFLMFILLKYFPLA